MVQGAGAEASDGVQVDTVDPVHRGPRVRGRGIRRVRDRRPVVFPRQGRSILRGSRR